MRTSIFAAGFLVLALALWMASGLLKSPSTDTTDGSNAEASAQGQSGSEAVLDEDFMKVQIEIAKLESRSREIVLQGQLEPARVLDIKAEISSTVETLPVNKGQRVEANQLLATLALNGRDDDLTEANAQVSYAAGEQKAASELQRQGLQSAVRSQQTSAALATAVAQRNRITRDIGNTQIAAPFAGILNSLPVELGELVSHGTVIAQLVDDSSFRVTAQVAQQGVSKLKIGQAVTLELITGQELSGTLSFVASMADSQTRSFTVEANVENPGENVSAGVSASLKIPVETVESVFLTPSALSLGDQGELGVKLVDANDIVEFIPVTLLSTTIDGAWVSGIPSGSRIITLGQAFVAIGEQVDPILVKDVDKALNVSGS